MDPTDTTPEEQEPNDSPAEEAQEKNVQGANKEDVIETVNILPILIAKKPEWVAKIAARVVASAKEDDDSREPYLKRVANQLKLFAGEIDSLGYPAQGAKAPHIAMMSKATLHSWARISDQVLPAKGDYVHALPMGPDDTARAQRVERHMNWQLRYRMPNWATSHRFTIMGWLQQGSRFRYYRWDPIARCHQIDDLPVDDVIISYTETDTTPQMKNVERITVVRRMSKQEMLAYQDRKFFSNLDAIWPELKGDGEGEGAESGSTVDGDSAPDLTMQDESPVRQAADKVQGLEPEKKPTKYAKRPLYEQHTVLEFPKDLGIDGLAGVTKPVIITVDKQTKKPVSLTIREEPDPIDQQRYDEEKAAHESLVGSIMKAHAAQPPQLDEQGNEMPLGEPKLPEPPAPVRMNTVYRVIHYGLFPNTEGFYRFGVGWLLEGTNALANALAAEFVLSAKFANMKSGFLPKGFKEKKGDIQLAHGKFMDTELEPEQMDKAVKVLDFGEPSPSILEFINLLQENSEINASADVLSGEKGSSNETAKGASLRNNNAMSLMSIMTGIYLEAMKFEIKLIAHGNSIFLDDREYFPFYQLEPDQQGQLQQTVSQKEIFRRDYIEDTHLEFTADSRLMSKPERVAEARDKLTLILQSPMQENVGLVWYAMRKVFEAGEDFDFIAKLGPPPQPPPPPEPQSQDTENAGFFNEKDHPVFPDDNHLEHLTKIDQLQNSPLHEHLSQTGKQLLDRHKRAHVAQFYLQLQALEQQTGIPQHELAKQIGLGRVAPGAGGGQAAGPSPGAAGPGAQAASPGGPGGQPGGSPPS